MDGHVHRVRDARRRDRGSGGGGRGCRVGRAGRASVAGELGVGANSLYHHLRVLEGAELIEKAGSRAVGRMLETTYRRTAPADQQIRWELDEDLALTFASLLEVAKSDVTEAVYAAADRLAAGDEPSWMTVVVEAPSFATTPSEMAQFHDRLRDLVREFRSRAASPEHATTTARPTMKFTYALVEVPPAA